MVVESLRCFVRGEMRERFDDVTQLLTPLTMTLTIRCCRLRVADPAQCACAVRIAELCSASLRCGERCLRAFADHATLERCDSDENSDGEFVRFGKVDSDELDLAFLKLDQKRNAPSQSIEARDDQRCVSEARMANGVLHLWPAIVLAAFDFDILGDDASVEALDMRRTCITLRFNAERLLRGRYAKIRDELVHDIA